MRDDFPILQREINGYPLVYFDNAATTQKPNSVIDAMNDYYSYISREDILRYQPIIAYKQDHNYIKVRNKGPYWLIYPVTKYPELDVSYYHSQMVWQINRISTKEEE